jgi:hypothetical protein
MPRPFIPALAVVLIAGWTPAVSAQSSDTPVLGVQKLSAFQGGFDLPLQPESALGDGMALIGDLDGNGVPDIAAAGSGHDDQRGVVWILLLDTDGTACCRSATRASDPAWPAPVTWMATACPTWSWSPSFRSASGSCR